MNLKRYSSLLVGVLALSLILFGIPLKVSAYHSGSESDLAANPELITLRNFGAGSVDKLAPNPELALVSSYLVGDSDALKIDSVRWSALGVYYTQNMARLHAVETDSARWAAIGDRFIARGLDADAARWAALGDHYLGIMAGAADDDPVFNPELILSRSYDDLASNPELLSLQRYETCGC